jgi:hypothetical protein
VSAEHCAARGVFPFGIGLGVWWFVWGAKGFWWGVLYGACWPIWAGYHLAAFLIGGAR